MFEPDLQKLDLSQRDFVSLERAARRRLGPHRRPQGGQARRAEGRASRTAWCRASASRSACTAQTVLDRPYKGSRQDGLRVDGRELPQARGAAGRARPRPPTASEALRAEIYATIRQTDPGPQFRERLRAAMAREFGARLQAAACSCARDTNVEDLPGFTGAGLNLTLFNVVGFDNIVKAITEVWASPYTPRAWAWRQSHMTGPEHVYPAVLLLRTVPADMSGVMVTQDVDTRRPRRAVGGGQRGRGRRGRGPGRGVGPHRPQQRRSAPDGGGHRAAPHGAAAAGRRRAAAGLGRQDTLLRPGRGASS